MALEPSLPGCLSVVMLTRQSLAQAKSFERSMSTNDTFTHFRHTRAEDMLDMQAWRVYLVIDEHLPSPDNCVAWGQAQLGRDQKKHVARLGIAVLDSLRGKGIGTFLVALMMSEVPRDKYVATIFADNPSSLAVFTKFGFAQEGRFVDEERWPSIGSRDVISMALHRRRR